MKLWLVLCGSVVVGAAVGVSATWAKHGWLWRPSAPALASGSASSQATGPSPRVEVVEIDHDFGVVERFTWRDHLFTIKNVGTAPLELAAGEVTCQKCTFLGDIPKPTLQPGEETQVVVRYHAIDDVHDEFRQGATILTNDPLRRQVRLSIFGKLVGSYELIPEKLSFGSIGGAVRTVEGRLLSRLDEPIEVLSYRLGEPETAPFFDVEIVALSAEELAERTAKSGKLIRVTNKPGLPQGHLQGQKLELTTNLPNNSVIELPILAVVEGDIAVLGKGWQSAGKYLDWGLIQSASGGRAELKLVVRGEHRQHVRFEVASVDPEFLSVSIGEPVAMGATAYKTDLILAVPPGTPPINRLGHADAKSAQIVLNVTHPQTKQFTIQVNFAVQK